MELILCSPWSITFYTLDIYIVDIKAWIQSIATVILIVKFSIFLFFFWFLFDAFWKICQCWQCSLIGGDLVTWPQTVLWLVEILTMCPDTRLPVWCTSIICYYLDNFNGTAMFLSCTSNSTLTNTHLPGSKGYTFWIW